MSTGLQWLGVALLGSSFAGLAWSRWRSPASVVLAVVAFTLLLAAVVVR
jgi:hypothetical protein